VTASHVVRREPRAFTGAGLARLLPPVASAALALTACRGAEPPGAALAHGTAAVNAAPSAVAAPPGAAGAAAPLGASPAPSASSPPATPGSALPSAPAAPAASAAPEPPADPANRARPELASADLTERARHLFDAIVRDEPALADDFFFPRAPFVPLKDVRDPARYFDELLATYHRDVRKLHRERKSWDDAKFLGFELGSRPTWVAPGEEWNKIGYFRTFRGKLRYEQAGRERTIEVRTIISWNGRWYATHLLPIKH
jgi:hypothetical protein